MPRIPLGVAGQTDTVRYTAAVLERWRRDSKSLYATDQDENKYDSVHFSRISEKLSICGFPQPEINNTNNLNVSIKLKEVAEPI